METSEWGKGLVPESFRDLEAENDARIQADCFSQLEKLT